MNVLDGAHVSLGDEANGSDEGELVGVHLPSSRGE
jgi:hypothetical protein